MNYIKYDYKLVKFSSPDYICKYNFYLHITASVSFLFFYYAIYRN